MHLSCKPGCLIGVQSSEGLESWHSIPVVLRYIHARHSSSIHIEDVMILLLIWYRQEHNATSGCAGKNCRHSSVLPLLDKICVSPINSVPETLALPLGALQTSHPGYPGDRLFCFTKFSVSIGEYEHAKRYRRVIYFIYVVNFILGR